MPDRVLYLPIFEPGARHRTAVFNKHGLFDALYDHCQGDISQIDYLSIERSKLFDAVVNVIDDFEPTVMLTQLHAADCLTSKDLHAIKSMHPALKLVNWSGDSWNHSLTSPAMIDMCQSLDLQLCAAPDVLPIYKEYGIPAKFWQIAYESPLGVIPDAPYYDVVFLGNVISDKRKSLLEFLRTLDGIKVGIYGDWDKADGECTYDFAMGEALYKNAKVTIADCAYPDQINYVSNRPIQALIAGGAILLHERVPKMKELLGLYDGVHYREWRDFEQLRSLIYGIVNDSDLNHIAYRQSIVREGQDFARTHHMYDVRVKQLFKEFLHR